MIIKYPLFIACYFASVVRGVEKMSVFPKKSLPAILNFASYIAARRGEVSELVEGARLEIVCTLKAYQEFESLPLRHRENSPLSNQRVFSFMALPEAVPWPSPFPALPVRDVPPVQHLLRTALVSPVDIPPHLFAIPDDICHIFFFHTGGTIRHVRAAAGRRQCRPHLQQ